MKQRKRKVKYRYSIDQNKYRQNLEEIKIKNLNSPEMLIATVNNLIHPKDSIIYYPKNINLIFPKYSVYPVYPLSLKEELLSNFDIDTLFFMFFEQSNDVAKEMARKEILKRDRMFNSFIKHFLS